MARTLKELYGLREMAINVPDADVASLRKVVHQAILSGDLPGEAMGWIPSKGAKGTPAKGTPETEPKAEPSTPKKPKDDDQKWADAMAKAQSKIDKGKKGKEEPPKREPIQLDPSTKADLDKSQSAWDKLGQKVGEPSPFKSSVKSEPMKGPEFDPAGMHPDYDMPNLGEPKSANVRLNKHGQPLKGADDDHPEPDMFAHRKVGKLSRVFGKKGPDQGAVAQPKRGALSRVFGKKQPQFQDNPYEFNPGNDWQANTNDPFVDPPKKQTKRPAPLAGDGEGGDDAMADLGSFLDQNPATKTTNPKRGGGEDAMSDLEWDLKRSRGKR